MFTLISTVFNPLRILNGHIHAFVLKYSKCNVIAPRMKTDFCFGKKKITYEKHQKYATPTSHHYIHLSLYIKTYININRKQSYTNTNTNIHSHKHTYLHEMRAVCLAFVVYECTQKVHNMVAFQ